MAEASCVDSLPALSSIATSFSLALAVTAGNQAALLAGFALSITTALLVIRSELVGRQMRSDISALLQQISSRAGANGEDGADSRGLVVHGNVQTIVLANTISVDTLRVGQSDETPPPAPPT